MLDIILVIVVVVLLCSAIVLVGVLKIRDIKRSDQILTMSEINHVHKTVYCYTAEDAAIRLPKAWLVEACDYRQIDTHTKAGLEYTEVELVERLKSKLPQTGVAD